VELGEALVDLNLAGENQASYSCETEPDDADMQSFATPLNTFGRT